MAQVNAVLASGNASKLKTAILKSDNKPSRARNDTHKNPFQSLLAQTSTMSSLLVPTNQQKQPWKSRNVQDQYKKLTTKNGLMLLSPTDSKSISMLNQSKVQKQSVVTFNKTHKKTITSNMPPFSSTSMVNVKHPGTLAKNTEDGRPQVVEVSQNCLNTKLWDDYR